MPNFDRRAFLGTMALAGTVPVAARAAQSLELKDIAKEADNACLYHCDFGDPPRFVQMLTNISNHYSAYGADPFALQLAIVAHGPGVKFFLETLDGTTWRDEVMVPAIFEKVEAVAKNGLRIYLCSITFERLKLDRARVRQAPYIAFVPSGVATVGALQNKGFAYIKIG
ncbi:DsrE family protein [Xanthobacter autotrophicus]|uniref:DsrE family protein n=1 Tax=Xanthobacter TaxID=279 RepID=UPI0024AC5ED1|nr:DsrE family protein [Xanthobacter autotrophicus]MDI4663089.1 DsrE family protein [Xanthobacter autotrophicus]